MIYAGFYTEILSCNPLHPIKLTMVSYTTMVGCESGNKSEIKHQPIWPGVSLSSLNGIFCKIVPSTMNKMVSPANLLKMNFASKVKNFPFVLQVSPSAGNRQLSKDCSPSNPMLINDRLPLSSSSFITMCALHTCYHLEFGHNVVPNWKYLRRLHKYIHTFLMLASKEYRWKQTKLLLSLSVSRCYAVFCWCSYSLVNYLNAPLLK